MNSDTLVEVKDLKQYFNPGTDQEVKAVDGVNFKIRRGETFGLVGESGSGKSTIGRAIVRLYQPTCGEIKYNGQSISEIKKGTDLNEFRRKVQMIFQDPYASLNPRMKIKDIIGEGIDIHGLATDKNDRDRQVYDLLAEVGLNPEHATRYPHEFSGGQRQRIGIARALAVKPEFIVSDEPISALDVSIQAQIINLLDDLQDKHGLTYLFIAHDLSMVRHFSDRIAMMYKGRIVEMSDVDGLYDDPQHPYTKSLLSAIPEPDPVLEKKRKREVYHPDLSKRSDKISYNEYKPGHFVMVGD